MKHMSDENTPATALQVTAAMGDAADEEALAEELAEAGMGAMVPDFDDAALEGRLSAIEDAEKAIEEAFTTGRVDRSAITRLAQDSMAEALVMTHQALESDEVADDAIRLSFITEKLNDREAFRDARRKEREARRKAKKDHRAATKSARRAYNAIRFSEPNRMGFMRVIQVLFVLHILTTLVFLILTSRDTISYTSSVIVDWIMVVLEGITLWLLINRYKVARPFGIAAAGLNIAADLAINLSMGTFSLGTFLWNSSFNLIIALYLAFSERVKMVCVNDIAMRKGEYDGKELHINRLSWPFVRNCAMYFVVFSVLGHWMEAAMCQLIIAGLVEGEYDPTNTMLWRDWLYPFPMEGAAVVIIALLLYPLLQWMLRKFKNPIPAYVISFVANALVCSAIEFSMGLLINADYSLWDYRENFGNIMGQVCLQNALAFGAAASIIAWFVYPMLESHIARVPRNIMNAVFVAVMIIGGILWSLYIIEPPQQLVELQQQAAEAVSIVGVRGILAGLGM